MGMDRERRRMKKPFFDHLKELNTRILFSLLLILIFGIYVYIEYHFFVEILNKPLIVSSKNYKCFFNFTNFITSTYLVKSWCFSKTRISRFIMAILYFLQYIFYYFLLFRNILGIESWFIWH